MPGAGACAGSDQQLVVLAGGDDLVHERVNGRPAAVDDALSADLDHRRVRQDPIVRRCRGRGQKLRVGQRPLHEECLKLWCRVGHGPSFIVSINRSQQSGDRQRPVQRRLPTIDRRREIFDNTVHSQDAIIGIFYRRERCGQVYGRECADLHNNAGEGSALEASVGIVVARAGAAYRCSVGAA